MSGYPRRGRYRDRDIDQTPPGPTESALTALQASQRAGKPPDRLPFTRSVYATNYGPLKSHDESNRLPLRPIPMVDELTSSIAKVWNDLMHDNNNHHLVHGFVRKWMTVSVDTLLKSSASAAEKYTISLRNLLDLYPLLETLLRGGGPVDCATELIKALDAQIFSLCSRPLPEVVLPLVSLRDLFWNKTTHAFHSNEHITSRFSNRWNVASDIIGNHRLSNVSIMMRSTSRPATPASSCTTSLSRAPSPVRSEKAGLPAQKRNTSPRRQGEPRPSSSILERQPASSPASVVRARQSTPAAASEVALKQRELSSMRTLSRDRTGDTGGKDGSADSRAQTIERADVPMRRPGRGSSLTHKTEQSPAASLLNVNVPAQALSRVQSKDHTPPTSRRLSNWKRPSQLFRKTSNQATGDSQQQTKPGSVSGFRDLNDRMQDHRRLGDTLLKAGHGQQQQQQQRQRHHFAAVLKGIRRLVLRGMPRAR